MAITAFKRYEQKFMLNQSQFAELMPEIDAHMKPDAFCQRGKEYSIYNIYYDTPDNNLIRTSLSKPYYKEKLRLRSYLVPTSLKEEVFLEIKKKIGGIVNKRRAVISLGDAYRFIQTGERPKTSNYMNAQVIDEIEYFLMRNKVSPATYISYKRMAFFSNDDNDFRITFDCDITTRRNDLLLENGSYGDQLLGEGQHLMEVKISSAVPMWLADALAQSEVYKTSYSKYGKEYQNYSSMSHTNEIRYTPEPVAVAFYPGLVANF